MQKNTGITPPGVPTVSDKTHLGDLLLKRCKGRICTGRSGRMNDAPNNTVTRIGETAPLAPRFHRTVTVEFDVKNEIKNVI